MSEIDDLIASVDAVNVRGRHVERIYKGGSLVRDHVTNLFTNPNLVGDGTWAEVGRNLFTNPNLKGSDTWTEVRRNLFKFPNLSNTYLFVNNSATKAYVTDGLNVKVTAAIPAGSSLIGLSNHANSAVTTTPGEAISISGRFRNEGTAPVTLWNGLQYYSSAGASTGQAYSVSTTIQPGATAELVLNGAITPANTATAVYVVRAPAGFPVGTDITHLQNPMIEKASVVGAPFDGSTTSETAGVSRPETYRWRWLGAENASESVMESHGEWAEVAENLFTNPNLVGDGTWAEVRRNRAKDPQAQGGTSAVMSAPAGGVAWRSAIRVPIPEEPGITHGYGVDFTSAATASPASIYSGGSTPASFNTPVTPGETITMSAYAMCTFALSSGLRIDVWYYDESGTAVTIPDGAGTLEPGTDVPFTWRRFSRTYTVPAGAAYMRFAVAFSGPQANSAGGYISATGFMVESGSALNPYFDHSIKGEGVIQPEDFRVRWLGTPNESESVMEIERVRGLTPTRCVAGVSTKAGKPAVRLIKTQPGESYAVIPAAVSPRTLLATSHFDDVPTGTETEQRWRGSLSLSATPWTSWLRPTTEGAYSFRVYDDSDPVGFRLRHSTGSNMAQQDVWWTDIGLFAGNYSGGAFSGDTTPETAVDIVQPEDFRWRWLGTPNESESIMEIERVRGLNAVNCVAGVSSRGGRPAVRLIPTGPVLNGAVFIVPITAPTVTVVGTVSLDAPLQGTLYEDALTLSIGAPKATAPNLAGDHPLRVIGASSFGSAYISLFNGASLGNGDVWWTDIGVFVGDYQYPWNGRDLEGLTQPEDFRTRWTGAENDSELVLEGEVVAGLRANECVGIVSTASGKPAVRVIPTTTSNNSYVEIDPRYPVTEAASYTALGTLTAEERPLLGQSNTRVIRTLSPDGRTPVPSWDSGSYPMRREFEWIVNSGSGRLLFFNGDAHGGPDVWWTDIGLFAGEYDGEWFAGDSPYAWWLPDGTSRMLKPL